MAQRIHTPDPSGTTQPREAQTGTRPRRGRAFGVPALLQVVAMLGLGAVLYPTAANWFATGAHRAEVTGYVRAVEAQPDTFRAGTLAAAHAYNSTLPRHLLADPYGEQTPAPDATGESAYAAYERLLRVDGTRAMGELVYPRLGIGLPIYHGTGERAISQGVGHLYGSSLPVGGPSTHSVLTSHSGLVNASLFTGLPSAEVGDVFSISVLGEARYYEVDAIETIAPFVSDSLRVVPDEDRVTLLTCTPIGVNSHRLLVHAVRVPAPDVARDAAIDHRGAGVPWWAVMFLAGSAAIAVIIRGPRRPVGHSTVALREE